MARVRYHEGSSRPSARRPSPHRSLQCGSRTHHPAHARGRKVKLKSAMLRAFGRESRAAPWDNEESIREELFSIERLEQHAESLAAAQAITARPMTGRSLAVRLRDNESVLLEAYRAIADAVGDGRAITPAAEWLLDNYHLVEEQIREIRDDLPPRLLSAIAEVGHRTFRRLSAGLRRGLGLRRSYGQPLRPRDAAPVRARLPARSAADDRRTVGGRDHAAHRARGESSTRGEAHRDRPRRAPGSGRPGRPAPGRERAPERADPRGLSALRTGTLAGGLRRSTRATAAGPGSEGHAGADVARGAPGGPGNDRRRDRARRAPETGCDERDGPQHHHQHAPDLRRRLGGAVRERQSRRRHAAVRQRLRGHGFSDAQPLPQRDRGARAGLETDGTGDCASGTSGRKRSGAQVAGRRCLSPRARSRLSPDRRGASRVRGDDRISRSLAQLARSIQRKARHRRLYRQRPHGRRDRSLLAVACAGRNGNRRLVARSPRASRADPGYRCGDGAREPRRHDGVRRDDPAGPGAPRRRTFAPAHDGRRPDPSHDAGRARRANRAPGDPPPCESGRRTLFRTALGLDGRRDRDRRRR